MLDLIIIGGSAAGCSAAIYAARRKLNFKMITDSLGGEVALSGVIQNWPGIISISGVELAKKFAEHINFYQVDLDDGWRVEKILPQKNYYQVISKNAKDEHKTDETRAIIISTGIHPRKLDVPGEKEFDRRGVTYCTVCDGPLFTNKITATIGSGNSALESALMMSGLAKKIYLISKYADTPTNNGGFPKGENILIDKIKAAANVEIIYNAVTTHILGNTKVTGLQYKDTSGKETTVELQGIMVHIGQVPNSQLIDFVDKTPGGEIIINAKCATSALGIFAAGDVTNIPYKQIAISSGQGVIAALAAIEYINRWK